VDRDFGSTPNLFTFTLPSGGNFNAIGLGNKNGNYYVLDRTNGKLLETFQVDQDRGQGIIGSGGFIYLAPSNPEIFVPSAFGPNDSNGILDALIPSSNSIQWSFGTPGTLVGSVAVIPGAVLFGDSRGNFYAVSTSSGKLLFQTTFAGSIYGGVSEAEGFVLVPVSYGSAPGLYAFAP
jgi:outer membrane protein assembly factor BamB